jgi:hypothetical protein
MHRWQFPALWSWRGVSDEGRKPSLRRPPPLVDRRQLLGLVGAVEEFVESRAKRFGVR